MEPETMRGEIKILQTASDTLDVQLSGCYTLESDLPSEQALVNAVEKPIRRLRFKDQGITDWDSSLLTLLVKTRNFCEKQNLELDLTGLPAGVQRLMDLTTAVPERTDADRSPSPDPLLTRIGVRAQDTLDAGLEFLVFLGDATTSLSRFFLRRARYRLSDLWVFVQECGPQALPIVTVISVLVGAILAFVGAAQLKMFGAEVYVANLVGLGMVIEMGALMTGIILAGRTGAAFAAQLGTMQVNEEIDALVTMGISPIDYLVLPRMIALAIMTPLLVIYADILGILGGAVVGIFLLDIPATLFFEQTFSTLTLWHCAQGLIKGCSFGVIVALAGCMRGMQCGRSASAVGDATTAAVVSGILWVVIADSVWTCVFMLGGG